MAAEFAFYGENSNGVGGDLQSTSWTAADMVGAAGMSPLPLDLHGKTFADENEEQTRERVLRRFEDIGLRLLNAPRRVRIPDDPRKRAYAAQIVGEAFVTAYNLIRINQRQDRGDRQRRDRAEGDLRRRPREAARRAGVRQARDRLDQTRRWPKIMDYSKRRDGTAGPDRVARTRG